VTACSKQRRIELGMEFDIPAALKIDADFSSQYEHNLPCHDLRGSIFGLGLAVGIARTATVALHHLRQSGAASACSF
jgi:hypothetical protein